MSVTHSISFSSHRPIRWYLTLILSTLFLQAPAQQNGKPVRLLGADVQEFDAALGDMQRLIGHVRFEYEGTLLFCDSAYLHNGSQDFDAFGNVRITKGSDYVVTGRSLHLVQADKVAVIQKDVVLHDREMTLTSNYMNYNLDSRVASYQGGGQIISKKNNNVLTSKQGYYNSLTQTFFFRDDVVLKDPEYTVKSDTLQYNELSEVAYFHGPTTITGSTSSIYCENGWYNTRTDVCQFHEHAAVYSKGTTLTGDSLYYDGRKGIGEVFRNVMIQDSSGSYYITGDYGRHSEKTNTSFVTRHALMTQVFETDSLFLHGDTLLVRPDSLGSRLISAYRGVRIFKNDLQGVCDSLSYAEQDSTIRMFGNPVLWSEVNQITGDSIELQTWSGHIEQLLVKGHGFIISEVETDRYNQIAGRTVTGYFYNNDLQTIDIEGNGEVVYLPTDDKGKHSTAIGLNKGTCSDIRIGVKDNRIVRIRLQNETTSAFFPIKLAAQEDFRLEGFRWRVEERPLSREDLLR